MGKQLFALLAILVSITTVLAQSSGSTAGSLTGTVKDNTGAALVGATVKAKQLVTNLERTVPVGEDGTFQILQLPPGLYEVRVAADGFNPGVERIPINIGVTALVEFMLSVSSSTDIIEIKASNVVNEGKTESSTIINNQSIESLPINQRNFLDFALTSARVVRDRVPAQGASATSGLSFNAQPARFNNITIDGLDNNDLGGGSVRTTFSQEAVQEFQVVSDSYSAEFGRAIGGVINIVTKGGSNAYHGTLFNFLRNDEISARNAFTTIDPEFKQYQFGAALSGPIKRDRAFFFTSFERLSVKQSSIVTISEATIGLLRGQGFDVSNGAVPVSIGLTALLARMDVQLTANDRLFARYNGSFSFNNGFEPFGGIVALTNSGVQDLNDNSIAITNTYINTGLNLINETRFLYNRFNQEVLPVAAVPQVRLNVAEGQVITGQSTVLPQLRRPRTFQFVDNVSLARGNNNIKFGVDYTRINLSRSRVPFFENGFALFMPLDFSALAGLPGLPTFTTEAAFDPGRRTPAQRSFLQLLSAVLPGMMPGFPRGLALDRLSIPSVYIQGFGAPALSSVSNIFSAYVQDDYRVSPNLLIKAGLRYDLHRIGFTPENNGNISPRLAFSYRVGQMERLRVRGAYGIFFANILNGPGITSESSSSGKLIFAVIPFPFSVIPFSQPGHAFPAADKPPAGTNFVPQLGQSLQFDANLRNSYSQQANFGFDYFLNSNTALSVTYDYVRGLKLFASRNINPVVRPVPNNQLLGAITGRIDTTRGDVVQFESALDSYYHALTVAIERRFANRFNFNAHYTFSKAIDNVVDIRNDFSEAVDPLHPGNERGLSLQDVRSRFVAAGNWELNYTSNPVLKGFLLSTIVTLESGKPYNLLAGVDLNQNFDNPPGDRPAGLGRNVGITPGFANIDVRLTRKLQIGERVQLQAFVETFNLFNRININQIDRLFPPDAQGNFNLPGKQGGRFSVPPERFRSAFAPRQLQLGFRLSF